MLLLICVVVWVGVWQESSRSLKVIFFDVGDGDATLILFPHGGNMLIDGGGMDKGERIILQFLGKKGIKKLDTVVLTNTDSTRVGGLIEILRTLPVDLVLVSGWRKTGELYEEFLGVISGKNINCKAVYRGQELGGYPGVRLEFLNPPHPLYEGTGSDMNNNSVVLRLTYGEVQFLFCGDIEHEAEKDIANSCRDFLKAQVVKVPCHGSESSSLWDFIKEVAPEIAVISVGRRNRAGYPAPVTLKKYEKIKSRIYRTDTNGAITVSTDGKKLEVTTMH